MSLNQKLIISLLVCGVVPLAIVGYASFLISNKGMGDICDQAAAEFEAKAINQLVTERDVKVKQVEQACADRLNDVQFLAGNLAVLEGMMSSCIECHDVGDDDTIREVSESDARKHKAWLDDYAQKCGYHDLYLITHTGQVVYTTARRSDLGENLVEGVLAETALGRCFQNAMNAAHFEDFASFEPLGGEPVAFIGAPVREQDKTIGVLAMQLTGDVLNDITKERSGMGQTGETYLVGPDNLMRSDSHRDPDHRTVSASFADPNSGSVQTEAVTAALTGDSGTGTIDGYLGETVLSAWAPVNAVGTKWALLAEIDRAEALAAADKMKSVAQETEASLGTWVAILGAGIALIVISAAVLIARSVSRPVNRIIDGLNEGADHVNDAANQIASASQHLAEGASEQASTLEETSSALEQMAAMTRTNAENAKQADEIGDQTAAAAQTGDQTMARLNAAMAEINESSGQISRIIKVIEEIAFQTNLLALNAAVEAARAGEHGRGFAVVADEVRNLAQRAAQAAQETTGLIENSVQKAREGGAVADDVAQALTGIVGNVTKVSDLIAGISTASQEQAQGVDQLNTAVSQMDKVTQQNASNAEESASAAEELAAQAASVKGAVRELIAVVNGRDRQRDKSRKTSSRSTKTPT